MSGTHSLAQALADSPLAPLLRRVAESQRAAEAIAASGIALPHNFDPRQPGTCELREMNLFLVTGSSSLAAKLRQSLPLLLAHLNRQGFDLTEIKVQLQPERMSYRTAGGGASGAPRGDVSPGTVDRQVSGIVGALGLAEKLALTLPGTGVGEAARRLALRLRGRLARTG